MGVRNAGIILKWKVRKQDGWAWTGLICLTIGTGVRLCALMNLRVP